MQEDRLSEQYWEKVEPYFSSHFENVMLRVKDGVQLRCLCPRSPDSDGALLVLGGRTEFAEKYAELIYDLRQTGLSFYSLDHRCQGLSQRLLEDRDKGHVVNFNDYVDDLRKVIEEIVYPRHRKIVLLAHSMGGAISTLFQLSHPGYLDGMILSSPMFGINCRPVTERVASWLARGTTALGRGEHYIIGGGPYREVRQFDNNVFTSSRTRLQINQDLVRKNPKLALGSPTYRWLRESLTAIREIADRADEVALPVLLLQSGADMVVTPQPHRHFCNQAANAELKVVPGARHELLMERDSLREQALEAIRMFLNGRLN